MFKRHKFTCPDIIYLRKRNRAFFAGQVAVLGAFSAYGWWLSKKTDVNENTDDTE